MRAGTITLAFAMLAAGCTAATDPGTSTSLPPSTLQPVATERLMIELELETLVPLVADLRGLEFLAPVRVEILDDEAFRRRVAELTAPPPGIDPAHDSRWLRLLGALPADVDGYAATTRILQSSVAFGDPEQQRVIVRSGAGIDPYVESAIVHELVHLLQSQHFGVPDPSALTGDRGYVYSAIIEGDARRITQQFLATLSWPDEGRYEEGRLAAAEETTVVRGTTPTYVLESLGRPAIDGMAFLRGAGNDTVDAYLRDLGSLASLPASSEGFVIEGADLTLLAAELPPVAVPGYEPTGTGPDLGVGRLRLLLQEAVPGDLLGAALVGWGGDALEIRLSGDDVIFAYAFRGETSEDAQEMGAAFRLLLDTRLAAGGYGSVRVADDSALVLAASDPEVKGSLDELFGDFGEEVFFVQLG